MMVFHQSHLGQTYIAPSLILKPWKEATDSIPKEVASVDLHTTSCSSVRVTEITLGNYGQAIIISMESGHFPTQWT